MAGREIGSSPVPRLAFISHHHEDVAVANSLVTPLANFGFSSFLAHRDLQAGGDWIDEIKQKLRESAVLIAIITSSFLRSDWTDQEVGFAIGRDVPVVPVMRGSTPYGFLSSIQGVNWKDYDHGGRRPDGGWTYEERAEQEATLGRALLNRGAVDLRQFAQCLEHSTSWSATQCLVRTIGDFSSLAPADFEALAEACATNQEIYNSPGIHQLRAALTERATSLSASLVSRLIHRNLIINGSQIDGVPEMKLASE